MRVRPTIKALIILAVISFIFVFQIKNGETILSGFIITFSLLFVWALVKFFLMFSDSFGDGLKQGREEEEIRKKQLIKNAIHESMKEL